MAILADKEAIGAHVVLVVDSSGSMRTADIPNYATRTAAVYDCLVRDLIEPQLEKRLPGEVAVTLIEMSDEATVVYDDAPLDETLAAVLRDRSERRARSHGNYLPALDAVISKFKEEATRSTKNLFLLFLSDGAPSDHLNMCCVAHGVYVWREDPLRAHKLAPNGKAYLQNCPTPTACRRKLQKETRKQCVEKIRHIGDLFGRERVFVGTIAFGPPQESYRVLEDMAKAVPRSSFQKLGLSADGLATAFKTLTSSLTTMRSSVVVGDRVLTKRTNLQKQTPDVTRGQRAEDTLDPSDFDIYTGSALVSKKVWCPKTKRMVSAPMFWDWNTSADGVAYAKAYFAEGAERVSFHATETCGNRPIGPHLIAKESVNREYQQDRAFYETFCRTLAEAQELATLFNRRVHDVDTSAATRVNYVQAIVYEVIDSNLSYQRNNRVPFIAEPELAGRYTKWNSNNGSVVAFKKHDSRAHQRSPAVVDTIIEEGDEDEDEDDDDTGGDAVDVADVPQAFSHFTHTVTDGKKLVCDIQGVWNSVDGFTLTDPVILSRKSKGRNGNTDKGEEGMNKFFATHKCNALCLRLGLSTARSSLRRRGEENAPPCVVTVRYY